MAAWPQAQAASHASGRSAKRAEAEANKGGNAKTCATAAVLLLKRR
jgi:hypothetical protein